MSAQAVLAGLAALDDQGRAEVAQVLRRVAEGFVGVRGGRRVAGQVRGAAALIDPAPAHRVVA